MSVLARFTPTSCTLEQYQESLVKLEQSGPWPPDGMEYHLCFAGPDGNLRVSEVWDSKEQMQAFGERLMPILAEIGIVPGEPVFLEVHNSLKP